MPNSIDRADEQFGDYRLLRLLGTGGFGKVYLGENVHDGTFAAIKVLLMRLTDSEELKEFLNEARAFRLNHPNIVRLLDFGIGVNDVPYLAMDYAPYGTLRSRHPKNSSVPFQTVLSYIMPMASALQYAHKHRLIHRDIKPENMLIGPQQQIWLSDFGIAAVAHDSQSMESEHVVGTWPYMAPEQIRGKPRPASDQYSLAIVVYEWLCGKRPFTGTMAEVAVQHIQVDPAPLRSHNPALPVAIEDVVLTALEKEPRNRFATMLDFADAFRRACQVPASVPPRNLRKYRMISPPEHMATLRLEPSLPVDPVLPNRLSYTTSYKQSASIEAQKNTHLISRRMLLGGLAGLGLAGTASYYLWSTLASGSARDRAIVVSHNASTTLLTGKPLPTQTAAGTLFSIYKGHQSSVFGVAWSPDGKRIASGGIDKTVQVWNATDGRAILTYTGHSKTITYVSWSPDGKFIASSSDDTTVHVWDAATGKLIFMCVGHTSSVHSAVWSHDGKHIASGSSDSSVRVWDATDGNLLMTYRDHKSSIWVVAWSPDGNKIVSASSDKTAKIWDILTGVTTVSYTGHRYDVLYVAWSPNGERIASGSSDTTVQIWSATTGETQLTYRGHNDRVYGVAWSPDGAQIASGSVDATVQIWDTISNTTRFTYHGHFSFVFGVAWSPYDARIASAGNDHTVQVWQA